jgi:hypothetical protein
MLYRKSILIVLRKSKPIVMQKNSSIDRRFNHALSQVFSPALLNKINDYHHEEKIRTLLYSCELYSKDEEWDLVKGLNVAYDYLKKNYRCEYVYKNEVANQILLKYHNDNSATLLKEVASDTSIADIVIINGKTVAYEIKTELDSFDRLEGQVESYKLLYDSVYIVTHPKAVEGLVTSVDQTVGIIVLQQDGKLKTVREASDVSSEFHPVKAGQTLRQSELVNAYEKYVGKLPKMGTALIHSFCYQWFIELELSDSHLIFAEALKSRKPTSYQLELVKKCSPSLKMLFLGRVLSKKYCSSAYERLGIFD